jgi:uncharacterized membrane protein YgcG
MRITQLLTYVVFTASAIDAASIRSTERDALASLEETRNIRAADILLADNALEKRKGGGGKGGGGGGSGGKSGGGKSGGGTSIVLPSS